MLMSLTDLLKPLVNLNQLSVKAFSDNRLSAKTSWQIAKQQQLKKEQPNDHRAFIMPYQ